MPARSPTRPPNRELPGPVLHGLRIFSVFGMACAFLSAVSHPVFEMGRVSWIEMTVFLFAAILYVFGLVARLVPGMRREPRKARTVVPGVCLCLLLMIGTKPFLVDKINLLLPKIIREGILFGVSSELFSDAQRALKS